MSTASLAKVKARLGAYITQCRHDGPVVITRNGKPVVVMIAPENEEDLERIVLARSPRLQAMFEQSRRRFRAGKGLSHEEFWKAVEKRYGRSK